MLVSRGFLLVLLLAAGCSGARRYKRTFSWLFTPEEPQTQLPIYRVHHYTGIHLQPLVPGGKDQYTSDVPEVEGPPPDVLELPEGEGYEEESPSALSSLAGLLPYSGSLLSGALSLSGGSSGGTSDVKRIGLAAKKSAAKDIYLSFKKAKTDALSAVASGAVNKVIAKGQATKDIVKTILTGKAKTEKFSGGIYRYVPVIYPKRQGVLSKIPFVGKLFGYGSPIDIPEVNLPYLPQLVAVPDTPKLPHINLPVKYDFPYKTGYYVKVKVPKIGKYDIPGTSYGVPARPVPVPDTPEYVPPSPPELPVEEFTPQPESPEPPTTAVYPYPPEVPKEPSYPYPPEIPKEPSFAYHPEQSFPYPPSNEPDYIPPPPPLPAEPEYVSPVQNYPYPPADFPYPGYYQAAASSENHEVLVKPGDNKRPVYRHKDKDTEIENKAEPIHVVMAQEYANSGKESQDEKDVFEVIPTNEEDSVKS